MLLGLTLETAHCIGANGAEEDVPLAHVHVDDVSACVPASAFVDGIVVDGTSSVDESTITREAIPVEKTAGSEVTGGTERHRLLTARRARGPIRCSRTL
jgi:Cu+-exporting ATPase